MVPTSWSQAGMRYELHLKHSGQDLLRREPEKRWAIAESTSHQMI